MTRHILEISFLVFSANLAVAQSPQILHLASPVLSDAAGAKCSFQQPYCLPYSAAETQSIKFPDLDGDHHPDICYMDTVGIWCALYQPGTDTFGAFNMWQSAFTLSSASAESYWGTIQYGDVDGDGKDDLCGRRSFGFECFFSDGFTFQETYTFSETFSDSNRWGDSPAYWGTIRLVDIDNDRRKDVCGRGPSGIVCALLDHKDRLFLPGNLMERFFSDVNGWNADAAFWSTIQFGDINGDHLPDVCARHSTGMHCEINLGGTFDHVKRMETTFSDVNGWNQPQYYSTIRLIDVNGDGKADLCGRGKDGLHCGILTVWSRGGFAPSPGVNDGFVGTNAFPVVAEFSDANGWNQPYRYRSMWFGDNDAIGRPSVCGRSATGIECARSDSGSTAHFGTVVNWVYGFGDAEEGLTNAPHPLTVSFAARAASYWGTVQPLYEFGGLVRFCGRNAQGIMCSGPDPRTAWF